MTLLLSRLWTIFSQSYWAIPAVMMVAAMALAAATIALDQWLETAWPSYLRWFLLSEADGARAILQTIAGSMITVAGVTFSITVATVAQASSQFGPRLMTNFMQDRGNQLTLGTFITTFLYCLLILRTVQGGAGVEADYFVPHLSIFVGLLLAITSLCFLVYFFHHMPESIHISNIVAAAGLQLKTRIERLYPSRIGEGAGEQEPFEDQYASAGIIEDSTPVTATATGFVQQVDPSLLIPRARARDVVVWIVARPGTFVSPDSPLAYVKPKGLMDDGMTWAVRNAFVIGRRRRPNQDILFLVNQLVEVAERALSPGVNDHLTAVTCLNWLGSAVIELGGREIPSACRHDQDGALRVVAPPVSFAEFVDAAFGQLRPHVERDCNAAIDLMDTLDRIAARLEGHGHRAVLKHHAAALMEGCRITLTHPQDRDEVERRYRNMDSRLEDVRSETATAGS